MTIRAVAAAIIFFGCCFSAAAQQSEARLITRMPTERNEPLVILQTKVEGRDMTPGKKFTANDEWIKSLVFVIKNTSDKRILFASIDLFFSRPDGSKVMFDIFFGPWGVQTRPPKLEEQMVGVLPGNMVEIGFSEQQFAGFTRFIEEAKLDKIVKVDMRIGSVLLEDDTMWTRGEFFRRDITDPSRWTNMSR